MRKLGHNAFRLEDKDLRALCNTDQCEHVFDHEFGFYAI
jgi:hypothetical protein